MWSCDCHRDYQVDRDCGTSQQSLDSTWTIWLTNQQTGSTAATADGSTGASDTPTPDEGYGDSISHDDNEDEDDTDSDSASPSPSDETDETSPEEPSSTAVNASGYAPSAVPTLAPEAPYGNSTSPDTTSKSKKKKKCRSTGFLTKTKSFNPTPTDTVDAGATTESAEPTEPASGGYGYRRW